MSRKRGKFWNVAITHHDAEFVAQKHLHAQSFVTCLPLYRLPPANGVRRVEALFPGYIFVRESDHWRSVLGTRGVQTMILHGERPARVHASEIDRILAHEDELGYYTENPLPKSKLGVGSLVRARSGALKTLTGELVALVGRNRAARCEVLFQLLGKSIRKEFMVRDLVAAA